MSDDYVQTTQEHALVRKTVHQPEWTVYLTCRCGHSVVGIDEFLVTKAQDSAELQMKVHFHEFADHAGD